MYKKLYSLIEKEQVDGVILFKGENLLYFSGFSGFEGSLLVTDKKTILYVDGRYIQQANEEVFNSIEVKEFKQGFSLIDLLKEDIKKYNIKSLGFESNFISYDKYLNFSQKLNIEFKPLKDIDKLRAIKTEKEIEYIKKAQFIAEKSLEELQKEQLLNLTELDVKRMLVCNMLNNGSLKESFDTIVAFGQNSSKPHAQAGKRIIKEGNFLLIDFGGIYNFYHSDMTRMISFNPLTKEHEKVYSIVLQAQKEAIKMVKEGVKIKDLDLKAREVMAFYGYDKYFKHSLGHGVGLEIHEYPFVHSKNEDILKEGMVITIEPGIYLDGLFGVRIEDMILVKKDGYENLTKYKK